MCAQCILVVTVTLLFFFQFLAGVGADVTLAVHLNEINSLMLCVAQANPVLFIRTTEAFGWSARDRLGISSTFQQGKDYYNPDSPGIGMRGNTLVKNL